VHTTAAIGRSASLVKARKVAAMKRIDVRPVIAELAAKFPKTFHVFERRRRPLKVGIHLDILTRIEIEPAMLSVVMRVYTSNPFYLRACAAGTPRIDLDGHVVGEVRAEQAEGCRLRLTASRTKRRPAAAPAPAEPRRLSLADLRAAALARKRVV
jgi:ProP effector